MTAPPPPAASAPDALKASEKLLDFMLKESERIQAETKTAEDRARGNATIAAGGIPLLTFLKTQYDAPTILQGGLAVICVLGIVVVLGLIIPILATRRTGRVELSWLEERQKGIYHETVGYDSFLHEMQSVMAEYIRNYGAVRDYRYRWLTVQTAVLGFTLVAFAGIVLTVLL